MDAYNKGTLLGWLVPFAGILILLLSLPLIGGCGPEPQPVDLNAVWQAGEVSRYDITAKDGSLVGTAAWKVRRDENNWVLIHVGKDGVEEGEMILDEKLKPIRGWRKKGALRTDTTFTPEEIVVTKTGEDAEKTSTTIARPTGALDNEQVLQTFRALPFAPGYEASYSNISVSGAVPFTASVHGQETVEVPAGTFETWHVYLAFGAVRHEAWYAKESPHLLVKYDNTGAGKVFQLRSYRLAEGAKEHGTVDAPSVPEPGAYRSPGLLLQSWGSYRFPSCRCCLSSWASLSLENSRLEPNCGSLAPLHSSRLRSCTCR